MQLNREGIKIHCNTLVYIQLEYLEKLENLISISKLGLPEFMISTTASSDSPTEIESKFINLNCFNGMNILYLFNSWMFG